jgi:hypothetical protein
MPKRTSSDQRRAHDSRYVTYSSRPGHRPADLGIASGPTLESQRTLLSRSPS